MGKTIEREQVYFNSDNCFTLRDPLKIKALTFTWMPSWWHANYGFRMNEPYVMDPDYRIKTATLMERAIADRFPMMQIGDAAAAEAPFPPNWINATTVAAAGGNVIYTDDNYPTTVPLTADAIDRLELPENIEDVFPYNETIRQTAYMNGKFGTNLRPHLFKNGISNDLVQLYGDEVMMEALDGSDRFKKLINYSLGMWRLTMDYNFTKGSMPPIYMLLNCTIQLYSPEYYEKYFFGPDRQVIQMFYDNDQRFLLHHCGHFDNYIPVYRKLPHVDMLQIGFTSDIRLALSSFPEADVEYIFSPYEVMTFSKDAIRERTLGILSQVPDSDMERFSLVVADLEAGTPDENVVEIYNCCK